MTFKIADRVRETTVTTGIGEYLLDGAAQGFQPFAVMGVGNTCPYVVTDNLNWEINSGQILGAPARLTRITTFASSNGGAPVNWGAGTKDVICTLPASLAALREAVGGTAIISTFMAGFLNEASTTTARTTLGALPNDGSVPISVPAGATGAQVPQAQEVVPRAGGVGITGDLTLNHNVFLRGKNSAQSIGNIIGRGGADGDDLVIGDPIFGNIVRLRTGASEFALFSMGNPTWNSSTLHHDGNTPLSQSLGPNGFIRERNGLIVQWGRLSTTANAAYTVTLPTAFPTTHFMSIINSDDRLGDAMATTSITGRTLTNFSGQAGNPFSGASWWAIGN